MTVVRLPGGDLVLTPPQARRLVVALSACEKIVRRQGGRLPADVRRLAVDLGAAAGTTEPASEAADDGIDYEQITTATAAQLLGCSPRNVRSLVARGRLTGRRHGSVLLVARDEVEARAARQQEHQRNGHAA
ncbi:hypothetical protein CEY15_02320 [Dietzia natronolimnaea]|uniref:Helix-turn-helix domain-containing protein n=1 Tax=Dietzia natronolimnaea TaxID=161920 RepID=A0A2A2WTY8_9ACTN|nr:helix-turn-helix domain-containing protein [Dietzia natronolimnaea]PAY24651.1 hypothetical protein CEY15_02320 [Dietzia natronolimnaea]